MLIVELRRRMRIRWNLKFNGSISSGREGGGKSWCLGVSQSLRVEERERERERERESERERE